MAFYNFRQTNLTFNGINIPITDASLSQEASVFNPYLAGQRTSFDFSQSAPIVGNLSLNFYLTGKCPIKSFIDAKETNPISININGLNASKGYLSSYTFSTQPNSPINCSATINLYDEVSGVFSPNNSPNNLTGKILNSSNITFSTYPTFNQTIPNNILSVNWSYKCEHTPIYLPPTGNQNFFNAERVIVGQKTISAEITSDNLSLVLPVSGESFAFKIRANSPTTSVYQDFDISGRINKKSINTSTNQSTRGSFSVIQAQIGGLPLVTGVTGILNAQGFTTGIFIRSNTSNGSLYSDDGNISLVERISIGGIPYPFSISTNGITDSVIAQVPITEAINGYLSVETTHGTIFYPSFQTLSFASPNISGFSPETGMAGQTILISGSNFYRLTDVLLGGQKVKFQVRTFTGTAFHQIQTQLPPNSNISKIQIISATRNVSGISTGQFYPLFTVDRIIPQTGKWLDNITISGTNFSGITTVSFNSGILSPSFKVVNNFCITGQVPNTGAGYTRGLITISGFNGMSNKSLKPYIPVVNITGISSPTGQIGDAIALYGLFDSGFLCNLGNNFFKVAFGDTATGAFYFSGQKTLTGLVPDGLFNSGFISLFEPDGTTKYPSFTGKFGQIGPSPQISAIYPTEVNLYKFFTLNIEGENFKDFFGLPYYLTISGSGNLQTYNTLTHNAFHTKAVFPNVRITGSSGIYNLILRNYAGNSVPFTGLKVFPPIDEAARSVISHYPIPDSTSQAAKYSPGKAADFNPSTYSFTDSVTLDSGAYLMMNFSQALDISYMRLSQTGIISPVKLVAGHFAHGTITKNYYPVKSGYIQLLDGANIVRFGQQPSGFAITGDLIIDLRSNPITGIKKFITYSSGTYTSAQNMAYGFSEINLY